MSELVLGRFTYRQVGFSKLIEDGTLPWKMYLSDSGTVYARRLQGEGGSLLRLQIWEYVLDESQGCGGRMTVEGLLLGERRG